MPELIRDAGGAARFAFEEFIHGQIRNPFTRKAYLHAVRRFSEWCAGRRLDLVRITPAEQPDPPDAWSRSRKNSGPICDRVGCYESPRPSCRCPARYCSHECRHAMQHVRDRERKWLCCNTFAGQLKCQLQAQRRQATRRAASADQDSAVFDAATTTGSDTVLPYRSPPDVSVWSRRI